MSVLRVVLEPMLGPSPGGAGRYAEELTRALIAAAPRGSSVAGVVAASPETDYELIADRLPGLTSLHKSVLGRRELQAAWNHGFTHLPGEGMIHAMSLLAPLRRHDRATTPGEQIVVTIHDALPWTHPELVTGRTASWQRSMGKRAERYADAVIVPTHAVGDALADYLSFGDRVRVIGGAAPTGLILRADAARKRADLGVPENYLVMVGVPDLPKRMDAGVAALAHLPDEICLVIVGDDADHHGHDLEAIAAGSGISPERVLRLRAISDADLAAVLAGARALLAPSVAEGFGMAIVEAFSLGVPVIHSDAAALDETAAGAGVCVTAEPADTFSARLAEAALGLVGDEDARIRLAQLGRDRAKAFTWRDAAEKVWQLHADL